VTRVLVVAAAGRGARLGFGIPKVLVPVNGRPMLRHIVDLHRPFVGRVVVVAQPSAVAEVGACLEAAEVPAVVARQDEPTGMLDAILIGVSAARPRRDERVWITWGDQVGVHPATLARLSRVEAESDMALPTVMRDDPYIHLARDETGRIVRVLQRREGDQMPSRGESDMGVFSLSGGACTEWLVEYGRDLAPGAGTRERNFLPFIAWAASRGAVVTCPSTEPMEAIGINTPSELEAVARYLRER
jgi:bifunctional UDP-N-acetylglucosamine pyrophosphorylase/glucosamine-1-phosphate N-acetyltransferase